MQMSPEIMDGLVQIIKQSIDQKFKAVYEGRRMETVNIVHQMAESRIQQYAFNFEKSARQLIRELVQSEVRIAMHELTQKSAKAVVKEPVFVDASAKVKAAAKTKVATPGYTKPRKKNVGA
jgi:bifunctional pyridoxal-dependent enzyme with beta-cystathionase and maltose regulon repressor activities